VSPAPCARRRVDGAAVGTVPSVVKFGRSRFYADENFEMELVEELRAYGFHVDSALELGLSPRDDDFHLSESVRRGAVLLSRDPDFLDDRKLPWSRMKDAAVVVLRTMRKSPQFGLALGCLVDHVGASGTQNVVGMKVEIVGRTMKLKANVGGSVRTDVVDIEDDDRDLFL
jgi:hypothetical protein